MSIAIRVVTIAAFLLIIFVLGVFTGNELALAGKLPKAMLLPDVNVWSVIGAFLLSIFTGAWVSVVVGRQSFFEHQKEQAVLILRRATSGLYKLNMTYRDDRTKKVAFELDHDIEQIESMFKIDMKAPAKALELRGYKAEGKAIERLWMRFYRNQHLFKHLDSEGDVNDFFEWNKEQLAYLESIKLPFRAYAPLPLLMTCS